MVYMNPFIKYLASPHHHTTRLRWRTSHSFTRNSHRPGPAREHGFYRIIVRPTTTPSASILAVDVERSRKRQK